MLEYITKVHHTAATVLSGRTDIGNDNMHSDSHSPRRSRSSTIVSNASHDTPITPLRSPVGPSTDRKHSKENFWCDDEDRLF